LDQESGVHVV